MIIFRKFFRFLISLLLIVHVSFSTKIEPRCNVKDDNFAYSKTFPKNSASVTGRLAVFEKGQLWHNATVHFIIDEEHLRDRQIGLVYQAFMEFHAKTCIRFKPWSAFEGTNYINITNTQDETCSLSEVCMKGGQQLVQIGGPCWFKGMVIHQLGHALCLGHEHQRPTRDKYLSYREDCPVSEVPSTQEENVGEVGFYDYASQMHFACGWCNGGWPKDGNFTKCGYQVTDGLSLLDVDYLNALYGCGGCHRHRWVPVNQLTLRNARQMPDFGFKDQLGDSLYPCRVSFGGEIIVGKFTLRHRICSFSLGGREYYKMGAEAEVLLIPGGLKDETSEYKIEEAQANPDEKFMKSVVEAGRLPESEDYRSGYVAFGRLRSRVNGEYEDVIGKAWQQSGRIPYAYFPLGGEEVGAIYFNVLTCRENTEDMNQLW